MKKMIKWEMLKSLKQKGFVAILIIGIALIALIMIFGIVQEVTEQSRIANFRSKSPFVYVTDHWIASAENYAQEYEAYYENKNMNKVTRQYIDTVIENDKNDLAFLRYLKDNQIKLYADLMSGTVPYAELDDTFLNNNGSIPLEVRDIVLPSNLNFYVAWPDQPAEYSDYYFGDDYHPRQAVASVQIYGAINDVSERGTPVNFIFQLFGILAASTFFARELASGSIKQVLLKPVSRVRIATAKLIAAAVMVACFWLAGTILYLSLGAILDATVGTGGMLVVWFGKSLLLPNTVARLFLSFDGLISALAFLILASCSSVLTKSNIWGVLIPFAFLGWSAGVAALFPNFAYLDILSLSRPFYSYAFGMREFAAHSVLLSVMLLAGLLAGMIALTFRSFKRFDYDKSASKRDSA